MQQNQQDGLFRPDHSIDTTRAMARGHDARTEALRAGLARLSAWLGRAPDPPRPVAPLAARR